MDLFSKLRGMNLLVIDDDEWVRDSLQRYFECEGCRITALEAGEEGLDFIKGEAVDIFIVDYRLPGIDGVEFIKMLPMDHSKSLKILITAYGSGEVVYKAQKAGVHKIIPKPFTSKDIEETLGQLI